MCTDRLMTHPTAAGRACSPTAEPTVTVLLGIASSSASQTEAKAAFASASAFGFTNCLAAITARAPMTVPAARATRNHNSLPIAKKTKIPPCGAFRVTSIAMISAPVTAPPAIIDGITRNGSAAANGIAPSEMNDAPSSQAALPFSRSGPLKSPGRSVVASARATGSVPIFCRSAAASTNS